MRRESKTFEYNLQSNALTNRPTGRIKEISFLITNTLMF
jgi:hypothetical protein